MKKLTIIGIVAILVMGLAVAAGAALDTTWMMQLKAYSPAVGGATSGTVTPGTKVGAIDAYTTTGGEDAVFGTPVNTYGELISTLVPAQRTCKDVRAPLALGQTKVWDFSMYIVGGVPGTIKLDAWMATLTNMLDHSTGGDPDIRIELKQGSTVLWRVPYAVSGTPVAPTFTQTFTYSGAPISLQLVAFPAPFVAVVDDGSSTTNPTQLHATWSVIGGVASEFQYAIGTSPTALIVDWTSAGVTTELTKTGITLTEGLTYYWYVKANVEGVWTEVAASNGITGVLPTAPIVTDDGADTTNAIQLHAAWSASDPWSVLEYQYAIGTAPGSLLVDWKSAGLATSATEESLSLQAGTTYYWYVRARNGGGLWSTSGQSDGITIVLPSTPVVNDDGLYAPSLTDLHAAWSASDSWGIVDYQYAIGTSPSSLIVDWKSAGTATEASETGLSLQSNQDYYFFVKANNGGGLWSLAGASDGIKAAVPCPIGEARAPRVGTAVYLHDSVVTSSPTDFAGFWVESQDRSAAVKVNSSWLAARGDRLDVAGIVSWTDGTPALTNPELKAQSSGQPIIPPGINNAHLANDLTETLTYVGINPVGLLVATWGKVTRVNTALHIFYVNDGSQLADGMGASDNPYVGLRVAYQPGWTPPAVNKIVRVVGIRTVEKTTLVYDAFVNGEFRFVGETLYLPMLTLRDPEDIKILR